MVRLPRHLRKHEEHTVASTAAMSTPEKKAVVTEHKQVEASTSACKKGWELQGSPPKCREIAPNASAHVGFISGAHMLLVVLLGVGLVFLVIGALAICVSFMCDIKMSWKNSSGKVFAVTERHQVRRPERVSDY